MSGCGNFCSALQHLVVCVFWCMILRVLNLIVGVSVHGERFVFQIPSWFHTVPVYLCIRAVRIMALSEMENLILLKTLCLVAMF